MAKLLSMLRYEIGILDVVSKQFDLKERVAVVSSLEPKMVDLKCWTFLLCNTRSRAKARPLYCIVRLGHTLWQAEANSRRPRAMQTCSPRN